MGLGSELSKTPHCGEVRALSCVASRSAVSLPVPLRWLFGAFSGQIMVLLCSSEGIMVLRSLANVYLLYARKPVTGTFPSGWKTKLIPVLTLLRPSAASEALMSLTFMSGRTGLWGSSALITLTDCPSQGLSPSRGTVSVLFKGSVVNNSPWQACEIPSSLEKILPSLSF